MDRLAVLLGGRVAEEVTFGEVSTGAHDDLAKATDIAKSMVKEFGMSERVGHIAYEKERKSMFLDINSDHNSKDYSEETAREIDNEIKRIVENDLRNGQANARGTRRNSSAGCPDTAREGGNR